ncbi:MAG: hypothetical protein Q4G69_00735 [Planctomycetia bacterium]|nr:hypothetical protein [Planctomycetia bacterium]
MNKNKKRPSRLSLTAVGIGLILILLALAFFFHIGKEKPDPELFNAKDLEQTEKCLSIWPDYRDIEIPCNIAPINYEIREGDSGTRFITRLSSEKGDPIFCEGKTVRIPEKEWKKLLAENAGKPLKIDTVSLSEKGKTQYKTIINKISSDPIDPWIVYRLIEPGYEFFREITLNQRCVESFREEAFVRNTAMTEQMCVNCHSFQNRETKRFLFHTRNKHAGTVLVENGKAHKVDLKPNELFSACTYPAWHPSANLIAFSVNSTFQAFHLISKNRIEVMDSRSDLILYDPQKNEIRPILQTDEDFETFPSWSPDGKYLYYCSAHLVLKDKNRAFQISDEEGSPEKKDGSSLERSEFYERYKEFKYDLMRIPFDIASGKFGKPEKVIDAAGMNKSIVHPRVSPDGRYLMFTMSEYGTFPIWHRESDLYLLDLSSNKIRALDEVNSEESESYHTWDSSGRWFVFSSRRDDGSYTRLYFAHFDVEGRISRPFLLPQEHPARNIHLMKSFNVPEIVREPITIPFKDLKKEANLIFPEEAKFVK